MILDDIKKERIEAMKNKDNATKEILSIILNEVMLIEIKKREEKMKLDEVDVIQVVQKNIKELNEDKGNYVLANNSEQVATIEFQLNVLQKFMPRMLSEQEILEVFEHLEDRSIGGIMKFFKEFYAGRCDMGLVSKLARSL